MSLEQKINYQLNKYPKIKKVIKRAYQVAMYAISPKVKSEGNIVRVSPDDKEHEYFFGYYDKSPWDISERYMLCLKAKNTWTDVSPKDVAEIMLIDLQKQENEEGRIQKIAETRAWNVQQGCMLQWLGPDYSERIIFNDFREGKFCSVILNINTREERIIAAPVYTVSEDGTTALTLDFTRLYSLRPGYGYYNTPEKTKGDKLPDETAVWKIDLNTGKVDSLLSYKDFARFEPREEMLDENAVHKVNHLMLSPNGKRFMVLYRWFNGQRKYTRLVTCNVDGTDMYVLSDDDMVSHCFWKNDESVLAFENKHETGPGYYLMKDKTREYMHCWPQFSNDGHPSYSPDRKMIVTDSYPNRARVASINIMNGDEKKKESNIIARVFAPFKYDNDTRCDLHPRWNRGGDKICFDSVYEGHRGLYYVDVSDFCEPQIKKRERLAKEKTANEKIKFSVVTPMYNSFSLMSRYFKAFSNQQRNDFELIIVDDCSIDGSYERMCAYAKDTDLNVKVIRTEKNAGPGHARNVGLKEIRGEWFLFVDSDDYVDAEIFDKLEAKIQDDTDIIFFDYNRVIGNKVVKGELIKNSCSGKIDKETALLWKATCVCGGLYKCNLLNGGIEFPNLMRFEDWVFGVKALLKANNMVYIQEPLYSYVDNRSSIVHTSKTDVADYSIKAIEHMKKELAVISSDIVEALYVREVLYVAAREQMDNYDVDMLKRKIIFVEALYPNWAKNRHIKMFTKLQRIVLRIMRSKQFYLFKIIGKII